MGIGRSIKKLFGYDSRAHDKYVSAMQVAQAAAYRDAQSIEAASNIMLGSIGLIEAQAGNLEAQAGKLGAQAGGIRDASDQAYQIGLANAKNIMSETMEWARRRGGQQKAEQSMNRAQAAASGIRLDTGGSSDIFREAVKRENTAEIKWGETAGKSQADIATREGARAKTEGYAMAEGVEAQAEGVKAQAAGALAQIPGIESGALQLQAQAGAVRTAGDLGVAQARLAQSQANSSYKLNLLGTAISVAGLGVAGGWIGAGKTIGTAGKVIAGLGAAGLAASVLSNIGNNKPGSSYSGSSSTTKYNLPEAKFTTEDVATVQGGRQFNKSALKSPTAAKITVGLPSLAQASESTKRQYASKTLKNETKNIFGGATSPLATA